MIKDSDLINVLGKRTASEISAIKQDLSHIIVKSPNLFNKNSEKLVNGYFSGTSIVQNDKYRMTHPIYLKANEEYFFKFPSELGSNDRYVKCDENGNYLDWYNFVIGSDGYVTIKPSSDRYVRINIGYKQNVDTFMFCKKNIYPEEYVSFGRYVVENDIIYDLDKLKDISDKIVTTPNLFNKNDMNVFHGYCTGAALTQNENYRMTQPIRIKHGVTYKYLFPEEMASNTKFAEVDENGDFVDWFNVVKDGIYATIQSSRDIYIRVNIGYASREDYFYIAEADKYPDKYIPFGDYFYSDATSKNPLWGKKAVFTGDSICYGEGFNGGYSKLIGLDNHMTIQNIGVSGGTIVNTSGRFCISDSVSNLDEDADYVILEGGVNDASLGTTLGTITNNYWRDFDTSTFCGAFEKMLKDVWEKYPTKKKGYILVHKCTANFSSDIGGGSNGAYYDAVKKMCLKWAIPVIDMQEHCPPMAFWGASDYPELKAIKTAYTKDGDGWHPNFDGYKIFYIPVIESWMKTL